MLLNIVEMSCPSIVAPSATTRAIKPTSKPYSTIVAPPSSRRKRFTSLSICSSSKKWTQSTGSTSLSGERFLPVAESIFGEGSHLKNFREILEGGDAQFEAQGIHQARSTARPAANFELVHQLEEADQAEHDQRAGKRNFAASRGEQRQQAKAADQRDQHGQRHMRSLRNPAGQKKAHQRTADHRGDRDRKERFWSRKANSFEMHV